MQRRTRTRTTTAEAEEEETAVVEIERKITLATEGFSTTSKISEAILRDKIQIIQGERIDDMRLYYSNEAGSQSQVKLHKIHSSISI